MTMMMMIVMYNIIKNTYSYQIKGDEAGQGIQRA